MGCKGGLSKPTNEEEGGPNTFGRASFATLEVTPNATGRCGPCQVGIRREEDQ